MIRWFGLLVFTAAAASAQVQLLVVDCARLRKAGREFVPGCVGRGGRSRGYDLSGTEHVASIIGDSHTHSRRNGILHVRTAIAASYACAGIEHGLHCSLFAA